MSTSSGQWHQQANQGLLKLMSGQTLSSTDSSDLITVANLCPLSGGLATFRARAVLGALGIWYDYSSACQPPQALKSGHSKEARENVGILEQEDFVLKIAPNPVRQVLTISWTKNDKPVQCQIIDVRGVVQKTMTLTGSHYELNTLDWKAGMYFVKIHTSDGQQAIKSFTVIK